MINRWLCECGKDHSLYERYCDSCGKQIPDYVMDGIVREESQSLIETIKWWFANLREIRYEKKYGTVICPGCGKIYKREIVDDCPECGVAIPKTVKTVAKDSKLAGVLGIVFGTFGVQNFYLGYNAIAVVQVIIFLLSIYTGWGFFRFLRTISIVGSIIQGILLLVGEVKTDAYGVRLK